MSPVMLILAVQLLGALIIAGSLAPRRTIPPAAIARRLVRLSFRAIRGMRRSLRLFRLPSLTVVILAIVIAVPMLRSTAYAAQAAPADGRANQRATAPAVQTPAAEAAPARRTAQPEKKQREKKTQPKKESRDKGSPRRANGAAEAPSQARGEVASEDRTRDDVPGEGRAGRADTARGTAEAGQPPRSARQDRNKMIAWNRLGGYGWDNRHQYEALVELWNRESRWNPTAANPASEAYGIPQANPGRKMAAAGADWQTNPATQITWGLNYIKERYGSPIQALAHFHRVGWY